ncbi:TROVE domain-containing protein [Streptomyces sp. WAC05374]|uniref:TROVE domain-containing protein n=1 Tax=Streptomyces sp. WAC05374 TaxID=2487420 RepID=UPI000F889AA9|nr:TROVE domain-containing protein [Streptomyces sp. WAC05374]RST17800.1 TROVE domain-containing protein [Streptomyces sp. WAC05374]TDF46129.1 TROVE domain-containing protein [Streptomyces sp. WAC05374]TDF52375.1 TROVE domain-containing protein [Streptomyces sp. WAC05374]TDF58336.1 TROVE domain-containing protein [Streptomyces sp. WAC05374]
MARFNIRRAATAAGRAVSPVRSTAPTTTHQGGAGVLRDPRSELFLLAVANFVTQTTFYESGGARDDRFSALVRELAVEDPEWTAGLLRWLRGEGNMRTASIVGAAEYVKARLEAGAGDGPTGRQVVASVLQRADEPGELLGYWTSRYGRNVPKPVKRGVADAVRRLYTARSLLKYDTAGKDYRFGDILNLVHASPDPAKQPWQGELFRYALDRRHHPETALTPASSRMLTAHRALMELPVAERRAVVTGPDGAARLAEAGMTWEALAGWLQGPLDAAAWEAVIPSMGVMALLRNLRNFDEAGVSDEVAARVAAKLSDPGTVAASRQFPFRYLAAYQHAPSLRWSYPLERALGHSLANVPELPGRTLVLVDRSGSMWAPLSQRSRLNRADAAAVFGTAVAMRAADADLVEFGTSSAPVPHRAGESVLTVLGRFHQLGGTNTTEAVRAHYRGHDRVLIVTDEQASFSHYGNPVRQVPPHVPVYTWNLAGYRPGHAPSGNAGRHTFGGLTDTAFRMVPLLEAGRSAHWPWSAAA